MSLNQALTYALEQDAEPRRTDSASDTRTWDSRKRDSQQTYGSMSPAHNRCFHADPAVNRAQSNPQPAKHPPRQNYASRPGKALS